MLNFSEKKLENSFILIFIFTFIPSIIFTRYLGNFHPFYTGIYDNLFDSSIFKYDLYFQNSFVEGSSFFYDFIKIIKISPDNDPIFFFIFFLLSLISIYCVYKIIKEFLSYENSLGAFMILCPILIFDGGILQEVKGSIIINHTVGSTPYAHLLCFPLILFALRKEWLKVSLLTSLVIMLSVKIAWLPVSVVFFFYLFCEKNKKIIHFSYFLLPLIFIYFLSGNAIIPENYESRLELYNIVLERDGSEDAFNLQDPLILISFFLSFLLYFYLIRFVKKRTAKSFFITVGIVSLTVALIGIIYTTSIYRFYPDPRLLLLSPVRSMAIYQFSLILLMSFVTMKLRLNWYLKGSFLAALFVSGIGFYGIGWKLGLSVLTFSLLTYYLFKLLQKIIKFDFKRIYEFLTINFLSFAVFSIIVVLPHSVVLKKTIENIDYFTLKNLNKWTTSPYHKLNLNPSDDQKMTRFAYSLRGCEDFLLLALNSKNQLNTYANFLAKKSKFLGDFAHFYFDYESYNEHNRREDLYVGLKSILSGNERKNILEELRKMNVTILGFQDLLTIQNEKWELVSFDEDIYLMYPKFYREVFNKNNRLCFQDEY